MPGTADRTGARAARTANATGTGAVLRIELRRSLAPYAGGLALFGSLAYLYLLSGPWQHGSQMWTLQWTSAARWDRYLLAFLWPLAIGAGALLGLRDRRSGTAELLATTPRPRAHRAASTAVALALALVAAYVVLFAVGAVQVALNDAPFRPGWIPLLAVGSLSLVAGSWIGLGIGRALPSPLTPAVLAVLTLCAMFVVTVSMDDGSSIERTVPQRVALLSPALPEVNNAFLTLTGRVHLGQTLWLLGLAATGFLLLAAGTRRGRLLALLPLVLGGAVALPLLPPDTAHLYALDRAGVAPVCSGPVCVTTLHERRLAMLTPPGRDALRRLGRLPDPPSTVRETTGDWPPGSNDRRRPDVVPVDFDSSAFTGEQGHGLELSLLAGAGTAPCLEEGADPARRARELAGRTIAAGWLLGRLEPLPEAGWLRQRADALARPAWRALRALPPAEQGARVAALRTASLSCHGDLLDALEGGTR